jgi:hypothetical protein
MHTPSAGRQGWHYDTLSSPHLPPNQATASGDNGQDGAGVWALPPNPSGPQDLSGTTGRAGAADATGAAAPSRDYGPDGAADGLSRSTPRQRDDTTTRPSGERADASVRCTVSEPISSLSQGCGRCIKCNRAIVHCNRIGDWCAGHGSIPYKGRA